VLLENSAWIPNDNFWEKNSVHFFQCVLRWWTLLDSQKFACMPGPSRQAAIPVFPGQSR